MYNHFTIHLYIILSQPSTILSRSSVLYTTYQLILSLLNHSAPKSVSTLKMITVIIWSLMKSWSTFLEITLKRGTLNSFAFADTNVSVVIYIFYPWIRLQRDVFSNYITSQRYICPCLLPKIRSNHHLLNHFTFSMLVFRINVSKLIYKHLIINVFKLSV